MLGRGRLSWRAGRGPCVMASAPDPRNPYFRDRMASGQPQERAVCRVDRRLDKELLVQSSECPFLMAVSSGEDQFHPFKNSGFLTAQGCVVTLGQGDGQGQGSWFWYFCLPFLLNGGFKRNLSLWMCNKEVLKGTLRNELEFREAVTVLLLFQLLFNYFIRVWFNYLINVTKKDKGKMNINK